MKNSPISSFIINQTLQLTLCIGAGSVLLASAKPKFVCRTARWWRMINPSRERVSTAPEFNSGELYTTPWLPLRMVILGLCAAARPWKPNSWSSLWSGIVLTLLPEAAWNSVVSDATEDRQFLPLRELQHSQSHSVSLCGLLLHGWAVVAPRCFHFTMTVLTVDRGSSSRA